MTGCLFPEQQGGHMTGKKMAVTISHQLGCGGSALGQKLSEELRIPFFDRQILIKVAGELHLTESVVEGREERLSGFWQSLTRVAVVLSDPVVFECQSVQSFDPDDQELFRVESECILRIAEESSGIFLGRCGRFILKDHPRLFNILIQANLTDRIQRVQELFCLEAGDAKKLIMKNDRDRDAYMRAFARKDWLDPRWYDLCVNTSNLGMEQSVAAAMLGIQAKLTGC
jgi:CMP/dCMP kinase